MTQTTPRIHPSEPRNYAKALRSMYRLTKDKENTAHVFDVVKHANGRSAEAAFYRFAASETGKKVIADPERLLRALEDRDRLRALPLGTFGRTYADFMDREGLDTNGVQEAAIAAGRDYDMLKRDYPEVYAYYWYQNLDHDLYHIVTGYHRDAIGEAALLRFTHEHSGSDGIKFIAFFAGLRCRMEAPRVPVGTIMREAARNGAAAKDFITTDWVSLLDLPLGEVRERLNVRLPQAYLSVPRETLDKIGEVMVKEEPQGQPQTA